jgi:hypothetical protein
LGEREIGSVVEEDEDEIVVAGGVEDATAAGVAPAAACRFGAIVILFE